VCLRRSPTATPAFLAANRRNAQKCTGPRTPAGKARSSLNALKHGRYARRLPARLAAAGYRGGAALYARSLADIKRTFRPANVSEHRRAECMANQVYALARRAGVVGTKPECALFSRACAPRFLSLVPIRILDPWNRVGLVFWVQRKGFWNLPKLLSAVFGTAPVEEPPLRRALEGRVRRRVFHMRRASWWERQKYGLSGKECCAAKPKPKSERAPITESDKLREMVREMRTRANPNATFEKPMS
jgi:hypothetical protein